ncbi:hypothetical protein V6N11_048232 [Hibiscus sabdariffa]|uniref:Uncharacterized protein n=1 Tax=Hibiscus sabdariffa TaxID=183260 RepID=A0ABR2PUJ8_9ROSI
MNLRIQTKRKQDPAAAKTPQQFERCRLEMKTQDKRLTFSEIGSSQGFASGRLKEAKKTTQRSPRTGGASQSQIPQLRQQHTENESAFDAATNGPTDSGRYRSNGHSRQYSDSTQDAAIKLDPNLFDVPGSK